MDGDGDGHHGLGVLAQDGGSSLLTFLVALYAFAMFGYITATIASHFVTNKPEAEPVSGAEVAALREEISQLRAELAGLRTQLEG